MRKATAGLVCMMGMVGIVQAQFAIPTNDIEKHCADTEEQVKQGLGKAPPGELRVNCMRAEKQRLEWLRANWSKIGDDQKNLCLEFFSRPYTALHLCVSRHDSVTYKFAKGMVEAMKKQGITPKCAGRPEKQCE
jgi:hypothetical protein